MFGVYRIGWTESEKGWGLRPDGESLHKTRQDALDYIQAYWNSQPPRVNGKAPDEYSFPNGEPILVEVDQAIFDEVQEKINVRR